MRKLFWLFILLFTSLNGLTQVIHTLTYEDTTYSYTDPEFELLDAASKGDTTKIEAFLEAGTNVNTTTWDGVTPLMYAAQGGHLRAVEILIDAGADINIKPYNQINALLGATIAGHVYVVDTLILNGANINTRNIDGVTPLMYAAAYGYDLMTDVLLFYNANLNASDNYGNQAIHFSTFYDNLNITDKLIQNGANIDATDIHGFTPLMIAAQNGYFDHVAYLIDHGADIDTTDENHADALALAILNNHYPAANLLIEHGADVNRKINDKVDLYDLSWIRGDRYIRQLLIENGAVDDKKLRFGRFILDFATDWNNKDFMIGGQMGLVELKSNVEVLLGFMTRPAVRSVLYEAAPQTYYQYWERRSYWSLGADKLIMVAQTSSISQIGAYGGLHGVYTYGHFRGTDKEPDNEVTIAPRVGFYFDFGKIRFKTGYEYFKLKNSKASPHRINVSLGLNLNLVGNPVRLKKEPDL